MGLIRLFLALVVAAGHLQEQYLRPTYGLYFNYRALLGLNAGFAVMFFYMISGFLISGALSNKYPPTPTGLRDFYFGRFVRIFSLYWPLMILVLLFYDDALHQFLQSPWPDRLGIVFLFGMDWRLAFAEPQPHAQAVLPLLGIAWTLGAELVFYAVAPFLLRDRRLALVAFALSAATRSMFVLALDFSTVWTYYFLPSTFMFFLVGHFARVAGDSLLVSLRQPRIGVILLVAAAVALVAGPPVAWDSLRFWCAALCFAAALPGVFTATRNNRLMNVIGDLSYPLYLTQHMTIRLVFFLVPFLVDDLGQSLALIATVFSVCLISGAALAHWLIEKPGASALRAILPAVQWVAGTRRRGDQIGR
jgi:peptidoglycan/LPS O-acetylase OafA/YrhL